MRHESTDEHDRDEMLPEYDFTGGVRGKHAARYRRDHTVTIEKPDGTVKVRHYTPEEGSVVLDPDVRRYFSDSESVNAALRGLIALAPKRRARVRTK